MPSEKLRYRRDYIPAPVDSHDVLNYFKGLDLKTLAEMMLNAAEHDDILRKSWYARAAISTLDPENMDDLKHIIAYALDFEPGWRSGESKRCHLVLEELLSGLKALHARGAQSTALELANDLLVRAESFFDFIDDTWRWEQAMEEIKSWRESLRCAVP